MWSHSPLPEQNQYYWLIGVPSVRFPASPFSSKDHQLLTVRAPQPEPAVHNGSWEKTTKLHIFHGWNQNSLVMLIQNMMTEQFSSKQLCYALHITLEQRERSTEHTVGCSVNISRLCVWEEEREQYKQNILAEKPLRNHSSITFPCLSNLTNETVVVFCCSTETCVWKAESDLSDYANNSIKEQDECLLYIKAMWLRDLFRWFLIL